MKKGSLSLSINAIVIFVLALALLGGGLALITTIFSQAEQIQNDRFNKILDSEEQRFVDDCNDELCLNSKIELSPTGSAELLFVVNNKFGCNLQGNDAVEIMIGGIQGGSSNFPSNACQVIGNQAECSDVSLQTYDTLDVSSHTKERGFVLIDTQDAAETIYKYTMRITGSCGDYSFDETRTINVDVSS